MESEEIVMTAPPPRREGEMKQGLNAPTVWVCVKHPYRFFEHDHCPEPGMRLSDHLAARNAELAEAKREAERLRGELRYFWRLLVQSAPSNVLDDLRERLNAALAAPPAPAEGEGK